MTKVHGNNKNAKGFLYAFHTEKTLVIGNTSQETIEQRYGKFYVAQCATGEILEATQSRVKRAIAKSEDKLLFNLVNKGFVPVSGKESFRYSPELWNYVKGFLAGI